MITLFWNLKPCNLLDITEVSAKLPASILKITVEKNMDNPQEGAPSFFWIVVYLTTLQVRTI
jgi:hypothetical protein